MVLPKEYVEKGNFLRIASLYRVSTIKQIDGDDIPMQRNACKRYIHEHQNWILVNEYEEKGVSGFNTSVANRDVIQKIIQDASQRKFDILLVFSGDRLCRLAGEYFDTISLLSEYVEIWSVEKGDITIRSRADSIRTYADGVQSEGESKKISNRISVKHEQMAINGEFRGGSASYGYSLVFNGRFNDRDKHRRKELYDIVINEEEAKNVRLIFDLAYNKGWGQNKITKYLNDELQVPSRKGGAWRASVINYILRNPIYKGYPAYAKRIHRKSNIKKKKIAINQSQDKWVVPEEKVNCLVIIPEEIWNGVKKSREQRNNNLASNKNSTTIKPKLLLIGLIKCGHCGSPLVTTHHNKAWTNKDGTQKFRTRIKYRCSGKQMNNKKCDGKSTHSREPVEGFVIGYIMQYLKQIKPTQDYMNEMSYRIRKQQETISQLEKDKEAKYKAIRILEDEIPKALAGESDFSTELIKTLLKRNNDELKEVICIINSFEKDLYDFKTEIDDIMFLQKVSQDWDKAFDTADDETKKMILSKIIKEVRVYDDKIEVDLKNNINRFFILQ